jgi:hypothetical protein
LIYLPLWRRWGSLGILVVVITLALWLMAPQILPPHFGRSPLRHLILLAVGAGWALSLYGLMARGMAYVQCFPRYLRIQTPILPLNISYRRIEETRLVQIGKVFSFEQEKAARRTWPETYWGMTAVTIDLNSLPANEKWLRLWFDRYLFSPETRGFVFLVEDWQEFSRQLNAALGRYRAQRARRRP